MLYKKYIVSKFNVKFVQNNKCNIKSVRSLENWHNCRYHIVIAGASLVFLIQLASNEPATNL